VELTLDQKRALAMASARARAADADTAASAAAAPEMVQSFDAMGNPTGGLEPAPAATAMPYGEQMAKVGGVVDGGVRMAANGLTMGMADRVAGAADALTGQAPSYSAGVDAQHARTEEVRKAAPVAAGVAEAAGGLVGGVGLLKNGVTLAGRAGPGFISKMGAFGLEGAGYGAAHGAGNTYSEKLGDYLENAGGGAQTGLLVGAGLPLAGAAAGGAYRLGRTLLEPGIEGVSRGGSALLRTAAQADEAGMRALPNLGPEGMLPDAGPSMLGLAQGAANSSGPGKSNLVNALRERDLGTNSRIKTALDENFGPAPVPSQVESGLKEARAALSPHYEVHLQNAMAADTRAIADRLDEMAINLRGDAQKAASNIRSMLNVRGTQELDPNPRTLLETRHAIDEMFTDNIGTNTRRALTEARQGVDAALTKAAPGVKNVDDRFAELSRQSEALTRGGQILNTGQGGDPPGRAFAGDG
jgi:hypothetical protein